MAMGTVKTAQSAAIPRDVSDMYLELLAAVQRHYKTLNGMNVSFVLQHKKWYQVIKGIMDFTAGVFGLMTLFPLFAVIAILIRIDSKGPAFYLQERVGKNGALFKIYKFRTMIQDAEKKTGAVWAKKGDPRLTRVGRVIRQLKLDELPQLINLVKGDMSLVGPRPERPKFVNMFKTAIPGYANRLAVKPGITGLAQIRNGYDQNMEDVIRKQRYDLLYIKKACLLLDLKLIIQTFTYIPHAQ